MIYVIIKDLTSCYIRTEHSYLEHKDEDIKEDPNSFVQINTTNWKPSLWSPPPLPHRLANSHSLDLTSFKVPRIKSKHLQEENNKNISRTSYYTRTVSIRDWSPCHTCKKCPRSCGGLKIKRIFCWSTCTTAVTHTGIILDRGFPVCVLCKLHTSRIYRFSLEIHKKTGICIRW